MRVYRGSVPQLSEEIVKALLDLKLIETESRREVVLDVQSVFTSYLEAEREAGDQAKEQIRMGRFAEHELGRVKKIAAEKRGIKVGDEAVDFLLDQVIEILLHSQHVDEVFAEDHELRRAMRPVLRKHMETDQTVEAEVRGRLKHMQEGTRNWEVEYQRVKEEIQRRKGLS